MYMKKYDDYDNEDARIRSNEEIYESNQPNESSDSNSLDE